MISHFDHAFSFAPDNDLDGSLGAFARAGFVVDEQRVRHPAGQLNGFISLTESYLEFMSIVDENEFEHDATANQRLFRQIPRPYGVVAVSDDDAAVYEALRAKYPSMKAPFTRGVQGDEGGKHHWSISYLPESASPGVEVIILRYLKYTERPNLQASVVIGANSVYAFAGFCLCADNADASYRQWAETLQRTSSVRMENRAISIGHEQRGPQRIEWTTPKEHHERFDAPWQPAANGMGALSALVLLCESAATTEKCLRAGGFSVRRDPLNGTLYARAPGAFGHCLLIRESGTAQRLVSFINSQRPPLETSKTPRQDLT